MNSAIKLNRKGPRYKAPRFNTLSSEWLSEIANHSEAKVKNLSKIKSIIVATNKILADTIVDFRDGVELPEQLGYMFLGTCQPKVKKNVDFKTTDHYLKVIQHRNWESDNYLAKIFYSNYETKYKFKFNELWGFKACREFTKTVGKTYPENWKKYIQVDHTLKIARLYRKYIYQEEKKKLDKERLEDYNPLEI